MALCLTRVVCSIRTDAGAHSYNAVMESAVDARVARLRERIREAEARCGREAGSVRLLAVSKQQSLSRMRTACALGIRDFGENHLQSALEKMHTLKQSDVRWHFIGTIQSRKAKEVARRFDWVHSLDRVEIARRLHEARDGVSQRLPVCVQVRIGGEASKSGIEPHEVLGFVEQISAYKRLWVRGLMTIPAPCTEVDAQRRQFAQLRRCQEQVCAAGFEMDELSMGMSADFEAAIVEGATWIRVGTALFGARADARAA